MVFALCWKTWAHLLFNWEAGILKSQNKPENRERKHNTLTKIELSTNHNDLNENSKSMTAFRIRHSSNINHINFSKQNEREFNYVYLKCLICVLINYNKVIFQPWEAFSAHEEGRITWEIWEIFTFMFLTLEAKSNLSLLCIFLSLAL